MQMTWLYKYLEREREKERERWLRILQYNFHATDFNE